MRVGRTSQGGANALEQAPMLEVEIVKTQKKMPNKAPRMLLSSSKSNPSKASSDTRTTLLFWLSAHACALQVEPKENMVLAL